jgi:hypothetical protein
VRHWIKKSAFQELSLYKSLCLSECSHGDPRGIEDAEEVYARDIIKIFHSITAGVPLLLMLIISQQV